MPLRILVIEDNAANLELMTYLLKAFGHKTVVARDGEQGLDEARRDPPDAIISDIQLPKLNGYELAAQLKKDPFLSHIPAIAVTAFAMAGDRERALSAGFDGYIPKPIEPESFVHEVEAICKMEAK